MKRLILHFLLRLLGSHYVKPLSPNEVNTLLTKLAKEEGLERLPDFLEQCAAQYRNQYLYSGQEMFKGSVLAFVSLREQILEKRETKKKKKLTDGKNNGTISVPY